MAVYARAFAFGAWPNGLAVDRMSMEQWASLIAERHDLDPRQADLFSLAAKPADSRPKTSVAEWAKKLNRS
jgi:hypothetical protein